VIEELITVLKNSRRANKIPINIWHCVPLVTLFLLVLIGFFAPVIWQDWALIMIASGFATTTFIFWWWVVYSVANTYKQFKELTEQFRLVNELLMETQELINTRIEDISDYHNLSERSESRNN